MHLYSGHTLTAQPSVNRSKKYSVFFKLCSVGVDFTMLSFPLP